MLSRLKHIVIRLTRPARLLGGDCQVSAPRAPASRRGAALRFVLLALISALFTGADDQAAYQADYTNRENGLIYTANAKTAPGAKASLKMDFRHADQADAQKLNAILWKDAMGNAPEPAMMRERRKKAAKDDDD